MDHVENMEEMVRNAERHAGNEYNNGEFAKFKKMLQDSKKTFYPSRAVRYTRLLAMVKLFQLKASND